MLRTSTYKTFYVEIIENFRHKIILMLRASTYKNFHAEIIHKIRLHALR